MIKGGFGFTHDVESGLSRKWVIGDDGVKRWHDTGDPVDNNEREKMTVEGNLPLNLRKLSDHMIEVALRLSYYGGFDGLLQAKCRELLADARINNALADKIESEADQQQNT